LSIPSLLDGLLLSLFDITDLICIVMQGTVPNVIGGVRLLAVLDQLGLPGNASA